MHVYFALVLYMPCLPCFTAVVWSEVDVDAVVVVGDVTGYDVNVVSVPV